MNRVSDNATLSFVQGVTPLTRFIVTGEMRRDQFDASSYRNSDNLRLSSGFESQGRISGSARFGVQVLKPHNRTFSELRGFFAAVATNATVRDRLQIGIAAERDVLPSFRAGAAYYQSQSYGTSITYALRRSLKLGAVADRQYVDYRNGIGALASASNPAGIDERSQYGAVISYRFGELMAIDFSGAYIERKSAVVSRRFDGVSFKAGVSHAF